MSGTEEDGKLPSRSRLCDFRQGLPFFLGRATEVVFRQSIAQELEGVFWAVYDLELVDVFRGNGAGIDEGLKVDDAVPVFAAVDDHQNFLGQFIGLRERKNFEEFVHGSESAGENDEGLGKISEPEFAHEEIVELKVQSGSDVSVGALFEGQLDVQTNGLSPGFVSAEVGGLHDARTSAGSHHEAAAAGGTLNPPLGQHVGEAAAIFIIRG